MNVEKPYIGVTGIVETRHARKLSNKIYESFPPEGSHEGMLGFLVSEKTLNGIPDIPTRYPNFVDLPRLLDATSGLTVNSIHYRTKDRSTLSNQITRLFGPSGIYNTELARTVQFNMRWPEINHLKTLREKFPDLKMIIQIGGKTLEQESRDEILGNLENYCGIANYVLIDPSGGRQKPINERAVSPLFTAIQASFPDLRIAVAGGITDENVTEVLAELTRNLATDEFGIDAEGGLRTGGEIDRHLSIFSINKAINYIQKASEFFAPLPGRP